MRKTIKLLTVLCFVLSMCAFIACQGNEEPEKTVVKAPTVTAKVYNGENQTADIESGNGYTVVENKGGVNAGEYPVVLKLTDGSAYEWETPDDGDSTTLTLKFVISKAPNSISGLAISNWNEGEAANAPEATAKFGTIGYVYSDAENGTYSETVPTKAGTYWVKAFVEATENYDGAESVISFEIIKVKAENSVEITVSDVKYNQTPAVEATAKHVPEGAEIEFTYSLTEDGEYTSWENIEKRVGEYFVKATVAEDEDYKGASAVKKFNMNKADNAISDFTIAKINCKQTPVLNAVATAGTAVTYKYAESADGEYVALTDDSVFTAGTYFVKAYTEGNEYYTSAESNPATLVVEHGYEWNTDEKGNDYCKCECGSVLRFVIDPSDGVLTETENGYELALYNINSGDKKNSVVISFTITLGETRIENAAMTWTMTEDDIVEISGAGEYTLKMIAVGETVLTATYTNEQGKKASLKISVTAQRVVENLSVRKVIEVENLQALNIPSEITGTVLQVVLNGENVLSDASDGKLTLDKTKLPKTADKMGEREMLIVTADVDYRLTAEVYTLIISDKAEFDRMRDLARSNADYDNTGVLDGYFILDSDIEYNGEFESMTNSGKLWAINEKLKKTDSGRNWQNSEIYGFKGVFDGRGYNVNGLTVKDLGNESGGIIGYMNDSGLFKNVSFTNARVYENSAYICFMGGGMVENVQISFVQLGKGGTTNGIDSENPRAMGAFYTFLYTTKAVVRNCVVDAINAEIHFQVGAKDQPNIKLGTKTSWKNVTNLVVLCNGENADLILAKSGASALATSYSQFISGKDCQDMANALARNEMWTVKGGLPFIGTLADKVNVEEEVDFVDLVTMVNSGGSLAIKANSRYSEITVDGLYEGVTFEDGLLSVAENALSGTVTVRVNSVFNDSFKEEVITIRNTQNVSVAHETVLADAGTTEIDLSFASEYYTENATLTYGSSMLGNGALKDGKLTVNLSGITQLGEMTFVASTDKDGIYYSFNVNVIFATKVIRTVDDLGVVQIKQNNVDNNISITGYYVLACDIDLGWQKSFVVGLSYGTVKNWEANFGFRGTFDGRGHTISNFSIGPNGMFGHVGKGAVIKNINFDKVKYNAGYLSALLGGTVRGADISGININVIEYVMPTSDKAGQGFLGARFMQDNKLTNIKIDASNSDVFSVFGWEVTNNICSGVEVKVRSYTTLGYTGAASEENMISEMEGVTVITTATTEE